MNRPRSKLTGLNKRFGGLPATKDVSIPSCRANGG